MYFLLGLNTWGTSQMKETVPGESWRFHRLIDEIVLCLSSQVLKWLCSLSRRSKSVEEGKWKKELRVPFIWRLFSESSLCSSPSDWFGGFHIPCAADTLLCGVGFTRYVKSPPAWYGLPQAGPRECLSLYFWHIEGVWQSCQETFVFYLLFS